MGRKDLFGGRPMAALTRSRWGTFGPSNNSGRGGQRMDELKFLFLTRDSGFDETAGSWNPIRSRSDIIIIFFFRVLDGSILIILWFLEKDDGGPSHSNTWSDGFNYFLDFTHRLSIHLYLLQVEYFKKKLQLTSCFKHFDFNFLKRSLQNHRTRIHKNLFAAIGIQVIIRLTLYMDQAVSTTAALTDVTSLAGSSVDQLQNNNGIHTTVSKLFVCFSGRSWYEQKKNLMFTLLFPVGSPFYVKCFTSSSSTHAQPCLFGCLLKDSSFTTSLQVFLFFFK